MAKKPPSDEVIRKRVRDRIEASRREGTELEAAREQDLSRHNAYTEEFLIGRRVWKLTDVVAWINRQAKAAR